MEPGTVVNVHTDLVAFQIATAAGSPPLKFALKPGETALIAVGYTVRPQTAPGAAQAASTIELLTGGRVLPAGDPRASYALQAPATDPEPAMSLDEPVKPLPTKAAPAATTATAAARAKKA